MKSLIIISVAVVCSIAVLLIVFDQESSDSKNYKIQLMNALKMLTIWAPLAVIWKTAWITYTINMAVKNKNEAGLMMSINDIALQL